MPQKIKYDLYVEGVRIPIIHPFFFISFIEGGLLTQAMHR